MANIDINDPTFAAQVKGMAEVDVELARKMVRASLGPGGQETLVPPSEPFEDAISQELRKQQMEVAAKGKRETQLGAMPFTQDIGELPITGEDVAATGAGIAVTAMGAPELAPFAAGLASAGIGEVKTAIEAIIGVKPGRTQRDILREASRQFLYEIPGAALTRAEKSLRPIQRMGLMGGEAEATTMRIVDALGGAPELSKITRSGWIDLLSEIAGGSFFGGTKIARNTELNLNLVNNAIEKVGIDIYPEFLKLVETGSAFRASQETARSMAKAVTDELYPAIYKSADNARIGPDLGNIRALIAEELPTIQTGAREFADSPIGRIAKDVVKFEDESLLALGPTGTKRIRLQDAQELRSRIAVEMQGFVKKGGPGFNRLKKLRDTLTESMREALSNDKALLSQWEKTNKLYKNVQDRLYSDFLDNLFRKTLKANPELIVREVFKRGKVSDTQRIKDILLNPPGNVPADKATWKKMQRRFITDNMSKFDNIKDLKRNILPDEAFFGLNREHLDVIYTSSQRSALRRLLETANQIASKGEVTGGGMLIKLMQGGALGLALTSIIGMGFGGEPQEGLAGALVGFVVAPTVLARMLVNPRVVNMLTKGLKQPIKQTVRTGLVIRIGREYSRALSEEVKEGSVQIVPLDEPPTASEIINQLHKESK